MSVAATISYSSLRDASSEASQVARKLHDYANSLNNSVYNKLNSYSGTYTGNIATAKSQTNAKISELVKKAQSYTVYANDLSDLKDKCNATDRTVRSMVSQLTATFKSSHGIRNSNVENVINYYLTGLGNRSPVGRWINNNRERNDAIKDYIKQKFDFWWNYEGGKQLIKGVVVAALEIAIAACAIILSGGTLIVAIAAVIGGAIALFNAFENFKNELAAYNTTMNGDPATGRRRSEINSIQDYLRSSFYYGDDGESYEYDEKLYTIALGIDVVNYICDAIDLVNNIGKLVKNSFKWATGSFDDIKELKALKILSSKENRTLFIDKLKTTLKGNPVKIMIKNFKSDFICNLKKNFLDFKDFDSGLSSIKTIFSSIKNIVVDGIDIGDYEVRKNIFNDFIFPNLTLFHVNNFGEDSKTGQIYWKIDNIRLNSVTGIVDKIQNKIIGGLPSRDSSSSLINSSVIEKLNTSCDVYISIPEIHIPSSFMPALRVA